ncbi:MAG: glycine--tRNA ligase subunit beta [Magnetococcales bacterium]|nr:glycine--tRNA ligase subunit beta [Magnetococcales bacterium]
MSEFLLEIGCEEIPARMLPEGIAALREGLTTALYNAGLTHGRIDSHGTPRRLMVSVEDLAPQQPDCIEERRGPAVEKAFDAAGQPTKAALGFARSCGLSMAQLSQEMTPKGSYLVARIPRPGRSAREILIDSIPGLIQNLPWPKTMRWGTGSFRFVRPIHGLVALLDGEILVVDLEGIQSGDQVAGHRFLAPGYQRVTGLYHYMDLLATAKVILDLQAREHVIRTGAERLAAQVGGRPLIDPGLLTENACLTEWPVPLRGTYDAKYLDIPHEVLTTSMQHHQKYFPVVDANNTLLPCFILVANMEVPDPEVLIRGNQRVLRARLEDAAFYWKVDRETPLADRRDSLKQVVFQAKLGTLWQKSLRLETLASQLAAQVAPATLPNVQTAAQLAKCDLITGMVGEFPELQGIMGGYYARAASLDPEIATAIADHYRPQGAADSLPGTMAGRLLAIADKLDTLVGCFGISLVPSGTKDPFALRRAALGIIRIILEGAGATHGHNSASQGIRINLRPWIQIACTGYNTHGEKLALDPVTITQELLAFFMGRLRAHLKAEGIDHDLIDAVTALDLDDLFDIVQRVQALKTFKERPSYTALVAANKRIVNILRQCDPQSTHAVLANDTGSVTLGNSAEQGLREAVENLESVVATHATQGDYHAALDVLAGLREPVDRFFDDILVMDPNPAVRQQRVNLLAKVRNMFNQVADVSHLILPEIRHNNA